MTLRISSLLAASLLTAALGFLPAAASGAPLPPPQTLQAPIDALGDAPDFSLAAEPIDGDAEVAVVNGRTWTMRDLQYLLATRPLPGVELPLNEFPLLRGDDLVHVLRLIGAYDVLAQEGAELGLELTEEQQGVVDDLTRQFAETILYQEEVVDKVGEVTDADVQARYEEVREQRFRQKEELRMRHIYTSTYATHTVGEGETLESIARDIGGDESAAERILSDETKRPRIETLTDEEGEELTPRPLVAGEILLVPVSGEKEIPAREKIEEAHAALEAGEDFEEVAKRFSENERKGELWVIRPADQERPIMDELRDAFFSLEDGEFSEPLRTRHGFQIVERVSYAPEGYRELDARLRNTLSNELRNQRTSELSQQFLDALTQDEALVVVHTDALEAEETYDEDVLLTIAGVDITRAEFFGSLPGSGLDVTTEEALRQRLPQSRAALFPLIRGYLREAGYLDLPGVKRFEQGIRESYLAERYLEHAAETGVTVTDAMVEAHYGENPADFERPASYDLHTINLRRMGTGREGQQAAIDHLSTLLADVETLEDFIALASTINPENNQALAEDGAMGSVPVTNLTTQELAQIEAVGIPGHTEPVFLRGFATTWYVSGHNEARTAALDEVRDDIAETLGEELRQELRTEMIRDHARHTDVVLLID